MKAYENLTTDQIIELRDMGGHLVESNDGSSVIWNTPNNEYKFVISRHSNELWESITSYMVTIDIYNNIGIKITTIVTTEFGVITLIYDLLMFTDGEYFEWEPYSSYTISFDPAGDLSQQSIIVERDLIDDNEYYDDSNLNYFPYFSENYDEFREIVFKVDKSYPNSSISNLVSFNISDTELILFCFVLFFSVLIDLDIPPKYMSEIEYITSRFIE